MKPTRNINYLIRPHSVGELSWREIFNCREMIRNLIRSSALLPYSETYFGYFWTLMRPFIFLGVLVFIKNRSMANMGEEIPYPLFLYSGLILWWYVVDAIKQSARSSFSYKGLITKIYFPRVILPVVPVIARFFDFGIQGIGLIGLMIFYGHYPDSNILLLPLVFLNVSMFCLGIGLFFAVLSVAFKDTERILDYILYVGLFISPVIYAIDLIPADFRLVYSWLNPTVGPLMAFRAALFSGLTPDYTGLLHSFLVSGILLIFGYFIFQRMQVSLAERM
jgi:lipopolysaccharide transport system permease protein